LNLNTERILSQTRDLKKKLSISDMQVKRNVNRFEREQATFFGTRKGTLNSINSSSTRNQVQVSPKIQGKVEIIEKLVIKNVQPEQEITDLSTAEYRKCG
jgi:hypothetical protein